MTICPFATGAHRDFCGGGEGCFRWQLDLIGIPTGTRREVQGRADVEPGARRGVTTRPSHQRLIAREVWDEDPELRQPVAPRAGVGHRDRARSAAGWSCAPRV